MTINKSTIKEEFDRDLYWTRIIFTNKVTDKKTLVLACISDEYFRELYSSEERERENNLNKWRDKVITKWSGLGDDIFNQDVHYDVYAATKEGEANGFDFLLQKTKAI